LLALGCNIFNLGFFPAFIAYPLIYRPLAGKQHGTLRARVATLVAAIAGLQLGALSVMLQTLASGISELPFVTFAAMMLPIHLAIGIVEGVATVAVIAVVARARPEALYAVAPAPAARPLRPVLVGLTLAALVIGGLASWFASTHPDGLEWAIARVTSKEEVSESESGLHKGLAGIQEKTALMPDYGFKAPEREAAAEAEPWPAISAGTSLSGVVGGLMTLALACLAGFLLRLGSRNKS
jgi:cobalt/nickel transport system permease protein